ncbi:hypothetical protein BC940DRAFT_332192 [Gongronella butleri]|nr:hypothetical protein BC940DRAFT_332192 [Gongronella butleri]
MVTKTGALGHEAKKFKGLFSEQDWKCSNCSNINWAKRDQCNQCLGARPGSAAAKARARKGTGGGFMERDSVIQYKSSRYQSDSDDEWDDFGRRKRKAAKATANPTSCATRVPRDTSDSEDATLENDTARRASRSIDFGRHVRRDPVKKSTRRSRQSSSHDRRGDSAHNPVYAKQKSNAIDDNGDWPRHRHHSRRSVSPGSSRQHHDRRSSSSSRQHHANRARR